MSESAGGDPAPPAAPPTCYRHHGRETYVRCTRCDRPICPDCMHQAAVGFHCPSCLAEGQRGARPARTALGGRLGRAGDRVTLALIAINVVVYLVEMTQAGVELRLAMVPAAVAQGEYYRLLTSAFVHASVLHIAFNMFALYIVGIQLEPILGTGRYLALYLLSALGGSVLFYLVGPPFEAAVGASGAIFGLFGALLVVARRVHANVRPVLFLIGLNLVLSFSLPGIAWQAHIGGLLTGTGLAAVFAYAPTRLRRPIGVVAPTAVGLLLAVAIVARTSLLTG